MNREETPGNKVIRQGLEATIADRQNGGYGTEVNHWLDRYPYNQPRRELGVVAMYQALKQKGSKAARFFEKQAIAEASQDTTEIEAVVL